MVSCTLKQSVFTAGLAAGSLLYAAAEKPNIVVILADDFGYGEVQGLNPQHGKIKTPHLDKAIAEGMTFTDGHSSSAVCTPTRYGLMTGRYSWRTRLQHNVLKTGGKSIVSENTLTLADLAKSQGYKTALIGKWHLGMLFNGSTKDSVNDIKEGTKITEGPIDKGGFDLYQGFHNSRHMQMWLENDKAVRKLKREDLLPELTKRTVSYIGDRAKAKEPFFLYVAWNSPHGPVVPSAEWQGKSGINPHADYCMQTDDSYGQVMQALKDNGIWDNTLVIYSSDNGTCPKASGLSELTKAGHKPSGELRGYKADIYEGGHRVPFIATWPKVIKAGTKTDKIVCLTDILATMADIFDYDLKPDEGVDSYSLLPLFEGKEVQVRPDVINHSVHGYFAIRDQKWKLSVVNGSGGFSNPEIDRAKAKSAQKLSDVYQLYDMSKDPGEQTNLADNYPEVVKRLRNLLDKQIAEGRSTPGIPQANDADAEILVEKWNGAPRPDENKRKKSKKSKKSKKNKKK